LSRRDLAIVVRIQRNAGFWNLNWLGLVNAVTGEVKFSQVCLTDEMFLFQSPSPHQVFYQYVDLDLFHLSVTNMVYRHRLHK
jgi:hypothetical protein